jgi:hypothetical protein
MIEAAFLGSDADELQIDYDAPDRLLTDYAGFLKKLRARIPKLSSTALAGWVALDSFDELQNSVSGLVPMFYDLKSDTASSPLPLIEPETVKAQIADWERRCKIPWQVGLPWFARVTIYDLAGRSRGHIRHWNWDDVCFNRKLLPERLTDLGMTVFRAGSPISLESHPIAKGETIIVRWPDLAALATVEKSLSRSVVYFRFPTDLPESGWSLRQCGQIDAGSQAQPLLRSGSDCVLELVNSSDADLPPRLSGRAPTDRGYALEVDAPVPVFREVEAGDFWRVVGHQNPDQNPVAVAIPLATRLTFWFSNLREHQSLHIPVFQLAPGNQITQLRYRILKGQEASEWRIIESKRE